MKPKISDLIVLKKITIYINTVYYCFKILKFDDLIEKFPKQVLKFAWITFTINLINYLIYSVTYLRFVDSESLLIYLATSSNMFSWRKSQVTGDLMNQSTSTNYWFKKSKTI